MATYYVSQAGAGNQDGTDASHAWSVSKFNTSGNWSATPGTANKISPGDTAKLSGTISSQLIVQGSGSSGNVITILFDTGAKMSTAVWGDEGAILLTSTDYITINGGATGTIGGYGASGTSNGIIECTDNGTNLGSKGDAKGVRGYDCNHIIVTGLVFSNIYVRVRGTDVRDYGAATSFRVNGAGCNDITVTNCVMHDMFGGLFMTYGAGGITATSTDITLSYCTIYNINWGGGASDGGGTPALTRMNVHHCYIHDFINWDGTDSTSQGRMHHNGFYAYAQSGGTLNDFSFYNNTVGPNWSTGAFNSTTAGVFVSGSGAAGPFLIYNNVFLDDDSSNPPSNGHIKIWPSASTTRIYNNTFVGPTSANGNAISYSGQESGSKTLIIKNNIAIRKTSVYVDYNSTVTLAADHNVYYTPVSGQEFSWSSNDQGNFKTLTQWKALGGAFDPDALTTTPNLDGSYVPVATSSAIDNGTDLSAYFTVDAAGTTRTAPWDIGAYQAAGGGTTLTAGNAPAFRGGVGCP